MRLPSQYFTKSRSKCVPYGVLNPNPSDVTSGSISSRGSSVSKDFCNFKKPSQKNRSNSVNLNAC